LLQLQQSDIAKTRGGILNGNLLQPLMKRSIAGGV
jgi:hypothetical protein